MESKIQKKNKSDLEKKFLAGEKDLNQKLNKEIFKSFFLTIIEAIKNNQDIELRNFGTFKLKMMPGRIGSNPKNQKKNIHTKKK